MRTRRHTHEPTADDILARYAEAQLNLKRNRNDPRWHRQVRRFEAVIGAAVGEAGRP